MRVIYFWPGLSENNYGWLVCLKLPKTTQWWSAQCRIALNISCIRYPTLLAYILSYIYIFFDNYGYNYVTVSVAIVGS